MGKYYFFRYAFFDALLMYQICPPIFLCAVINDYVPSGVFSQDFSVPSTL